MSKSSYLTANVDVTSDSFGGWIGKTNLVIADMGTVVVTVNDVAQPNTTNGAQTSGNAHVEGIFSATTLSAVDALTGGTVSVPAILSITSNAEFTSTNGTIDVTSSINLFTVDANNVVVSSNVVFDGGASKIFKIDAANTTINTGSFYAKSNTYISGPNTYITSTELKSTSNTIITGARVDLDGTTFDVTSNTIFTATSFNANVDIMTVGFSAADTLNVNAISDFNANVNIDGILTQTANAVFTGALVSITSLNTTIGDAGTDVLNVNAISDFNANVNIDGILTQTANATFSGAETYFNNNVTLGATTADTVSILGYVDANVLPSAITVDLGSDAKPFGNVHTTYVWSDNNIDTQGDFIVRGSTSRTLKAISTTTSYQDLNIILRTSTGNEKTPLVANSSSVSGGANTTYDLGSTTNNWNKLYVKDAAVANSAVVSNVLTVNSQANTASLMVRDLTATRVPFVSTGGEIVDSANFVFNSANSTFAVTGNTTVSANLSVTNVVSAANVAATHVGTATLGTSGLATLNSMNVVNTATFNANVDLQDSDYLLIGTSDDLQLFHDGLHSYIKDTGTGDLIVDASIFRVMNAANTENMIVATQDSGVILYANNIARVETTLVGANVTGTFGVSGLSTLSSANVTNSFQVNGLSSLVGNTAFANNVTITGDLTVSGTTNLATDADFTVNNAISTTSTVNGLFTNNGNTVLGDTNVDIVTINAKIASSIIPNANNTYDLGATGTGLYKTIYANNFVGATAWASVTDKPDPVITVTLSGDVVGTGSATLTDLASGSMSFATTIQANSVALGTDTTGNYMSGVTAGGGITVTHTASEGSSATIAHTDTSTVSNLAIDNSGGTVLQDLSLTFDTYGHVTATSTASTNLDNRYPQVTFKTITVDDTDTEYTWAATGSAVADGLTDTLTFVSGTDINIDVDAALDAIRIQDTSTLQTVTTRGATTNNAISITNTTDAASTVTGALIVSGGLGLAKQLRVGTTMNVTGAATFANTASFANNVTISGDLTVNGTTTTINSTTVTYDDKNIELGSVVSPSDAGADGGGITLKGTTDKTFNWVDATDAWSSSEHINLLSSKAYYINGNSVLNSTTLGSGVTGSSLTSVGTLSTGTWSASTIAVNKGGTGQTTYTNGQLLIGNTTGNTLSKATLTAGSNVTITNGTGSITINADKTTNLTATAGTTAGPVINSSTGTNVTIPSASATASGIVTTGTQTFAGTKTFNTGTLSALTFNATSTTNGGFQGIDADTITAPSFTWTSDQNTGMWHAGTDQIGFTTAGVNRLTIATTAIISTLPITAKSLTSTDGDINLATWSIDASLHNASGNNVYYSNATHNFTGTIVGALTGNVTGNVTGSSGSTTGNAATATKLATARAIAVSGAVTGTANFDGSGNISIATTATSDPTLTLTGDASGSATFTNLGNASLAVVVADDSHSHAFNNLSAKTGGTGNYTTTGIFTAATFNATSVTSGGFQGIDADTIAAPSFTWTSDLDTGMWHAATNQIGFTTAGVNRMTISSTGISVVGAIGASGNIASTSDARLKENVVTIDSALNKVEQMRGVYFNKIDDETKTRNVGVIAQEMEEVLPEVVHTREDGMKSVAYANIVGVLIEAIKELKAEIDILKANK